MLGKIVIHVLRHEVMFLWQAERLACGIDKLCAGFAMCLVGACNFGDAFADKRVRNDELRFPVIAPLRHVKCIEKLSHVVAIDFLNIEAVCFHSFARVFALRFLRRGIERDCVRIVNEN